MKKVLSKDTHIFNTKYKRHLIFMLYGIVIIDMLRIIASTGKVSMGISTYILVAIEYISLLILLKISIDSDIKQHVPFSIKTGYLIWIIINVISISRGIVFAGGYWDYKFLFLTSFSFSAISLVFFIGVNHKYFSYIYKEFFTRIVWLALILGLCFFSYNHEIFPRLVIPVTFLLCFIPYVPFNTKVTLLAVAGLSFFIAIDFRTNVIKMALAIIILFLYFLKRKFNINLYRLAHSILMILPIILLILGLTGRFNTFSEVSNIDLGTTSTLNNRQASVTADTRSFLYREVIASVMQTGNWFLGESSSGSYRSIFFINSGGAMNGRRYGTEVGILNIFLYHGILGVGAYFFLLYIVSSVAIKRSNNDLSKMLGVLIASRWTLSFVEEFTRFDMNFFFFWLIVGLVSTNSFRSLSHNEVVHFFKTQSSQSRAFRRFRARLVGKL